MIQIFPFLRMPVLLQNSDNVAANAAKMSNYAYQARFSLLMTSRKKRHQY
jgi:hypothetical protein